MRHILVLVVVSLGVFEEAAGACTTVGGAKSGEDCVFPFKARGVEYKQCTYAGGFAIPWCSTKVDSSGNTVLGYWGDCPTTDPSNCFPEATTDAGDSATDAASKVTTAKVVGSCTTIGGAQPGVPCAFPFKARGVEYNKCTYAGGFSTPWCATKVDSSGNTVLGNWGDCPVSDACIPPSAAPTEAQTTPQETSPVETSLADTSLADTSLAETSLGETSPAETTTSTTTTVEAAPDGSSPIRG